MITFTSGGGGGSTRESAAPMLRLPSPIVSDTHLKNSLNDVLSSVSRAYTFSVSSFSGYVLSFIPAANAMMPQKCRRLTSGTISL